MQIHEVLIPVFLFLCIAIIWGAWLLTRHKERMTMIERGLKAEEIRQLYARRGFSFNVLSSLKWGMVFAGVGLAVLVGLYLEVGLGMPDGVYPGLIALLGGLGLMAFYSIASKKGRDSGGV